MTRRKRLISRTIIKRTVKDFILGGLTAFGALRAIALFFDALKPYSDIVIIAVSLTCGIWKCRYRSHIAIKVPTTNSSIEIMFGDIFDGTDLIVIPVNEYFDGELGDLVSKDSLHGKFIKNVLGGQYSSFCNLTDDALESIRSVPVQRKRGRNKQYPIGTVASVDVGDRRYLLSALSRTNIETSTASATVPDLWACLEGTWKAIQNYSNGGVARVPLIGSGLSKVGLPPSNLIEIILISFVDSTKSLRRITDKVVLVLDPILKGEVDLISVKRRWSQGRWS